MNQVLTKWFCNDVQINVTPNSLFLGFDPKPIIPYMIDESIDLEIAILEGRHLFPGIKKGSDCNIQVKWEIIGSNVDTCMGTSKGMIFFFVSIFFSSLLAILLISVVNNAFNPKWDEKFDVGLIIAPSLAVLRISVYNLIKKSKTSDFLCQATLPLDHLRQGYR